MTELDKRIEEVAEDVERGSYRSAGRTSLQRFGERLKRWREDRGYSRRDLVRDLKERGIPCSASNVSYWESGKRMPSPDTLDALCDILQISGAHLIGPDSLERDTVIALFEVIGSLPEEHQRAIQTLYARQLQRREAQQKEKERQQKQDIRDLKKILGV